MRSGAHALLLLAARLDVAILRALGDGPMRQIDLRRTTGSPAQTTLRAHIRRLVAAGVVERHRGEGFPGGVQLDLTDAGHDLLSVADALQRWLEGATGGPQPLDADPAAAAIKALAEGWSTTILRALAAGPRTLTELDRLIAATSYPALERRLATLRLAGLAEARPGNGKGTPHAATGWLRAGAMPLAAAARWERRHLPQATRPIGRLDVETIFLLAAPLLRPSEERSGSCRMAAELGGNGRDRLAGVVVEARDGRIASCSTRLQSDSEAWVRGSPGAWLDAVVEGDRDRLELGGDCALAHDLLDGLSRISPGRASQPLSSPSSSLPSRTDPAAWS